MEQIPLVWCSRQFLVAAYLLVLCGAITIMFTLNWSGFKAALHKEVEHQRALKHSRPAAAPAPAQH